MADQSGLAILATYPEAWQRFLLVFFAANLVTGLLYWAARRWKLLPAIRERDVHTERKPRVGGIAMWLVFVGALLITLATGGLGLDKLGVNPNTLLGIGGGLSVILLFGLIDDIFGLSALWQFFGQFLAALSVVAGGLQVSYITLPLIGQLTLPPIWSAVIVVLWIVFTINAVNLFDGLDGLAGGIGITASAILFLVSLKLGFLGAATLCFILFATVSGFIPWNWYPSKLFMGTVGSQLIGFVLAVAAVASGAKVATAVLVLGIPLFDAFSVVLRRLLARENPFQADQRHLHHRLLHLGLKPPHVVLITSGFAITFGLLALGTQQANEKGLLIILLVISMGLFILITHILERRARRA